MFCYIPHSVWPLTLEPSANSHTDSSFNAIPKKKGCSFSVLEINLAYPDYVLYLKSLFILSVAAEVSKTYLHIAGSPFLFLFKSFAQLHLFIYLFFWTRKAQKKPANSFVKENRVSSNKTQNNIFLQYSICQCRAVYYPLRCFRKLDLIYKKKNDGEKEKAGWHLPRCQAVFAKKTIVLTKWSLVKYKTPSLCSLNLFTLPVSSGGRQSVNSSCYLYIKFTIAFASAPLASDQIRLSSGKPFLFLL